MWWWFVPGKCSGITSCWLCLWAPQVHGNGRTNTYLRTIIFIVCSLRCVRDTVKIHTFVILSYVQLKPAVAPGGDFYDSMQWSAPADREVKALEYFTTVCPHPCPNSSGILITKYSACKYPLQQSATSFILQEFWIQQTRKLVQIKVKGGCWRSEKGMACKRMDIT